MNDLIERLRLGDGTSADHELLLEAADALEALAQPEQEPVKELTDDEINEVSKEIFKGYKNFYHYQINFARAILRKAREKCTK